MGLFGRIRDRLRRAWAMSAMQARVATYQKNRDRDLGGKTADQWDKTWKKVGGLDSDVGDWLGKAGLYRLRLGQKIVYIGCASDPGNGGLSTAIRRLSDPDALPRDALEALIRDNHERLKVDLLTTGSDAMAEEAARQLVLMLVGKHTPEWNRLA